MRDQDAPRARRVPVVAEEPLIGSDRYDYADAFEIRVREPDARSAEQFARCALERAPWPVRWTIWIAHRYLLRLRLGPRTSPDHILGWKILTSEPEVIQLGAVSPLLGRGVIVGRRVDPTCMVITTYVFYRRPALARVVWKIAGPLHRRVAAYLLEQAAADRAEYPAAVHGMRIPNSAHTSRPWRIHELTRDFRLEDVWALPAAGGPDDFPRLVQLIASLDPSQSSSGAIRTLFAIRRKIGELLGWDGSDTGLGSRVPTLRDRLPGDLRDAPSGPDFGALTFTSLYLLDDEWAAEIANRTMHGVMHVGWVPDQTGGHRGQMAVYVKRNGLLGTAYMAAIWPFRHLIVYPPMLREMGRNWRAGTRSASSLARHSDVNASPRPTPDRWASVHTSTDPLPQSRSIR